MAFGCGLATAAAPGGDTNAPRRAACARGASSGVCAQTRLSRGQPSALALPLACDTPLAAHEVAERRGAA